MDFPPPSCSPLAATTAIPAVAQNSCQQSGPQLGPGRCDCADRDPAPAECGHCRCAFCRSARLLFSPPVCPGAFARSDLRGEHILTHYMD